MIDGRILRAGLEPLLVRFNLNRRSDAGSVVHRHHRDFPALLELFKGDDTVDLESSTGRWRATVHIWEPSSLDPLEGSFRFEVQGEPAST